MPFIANTVAVNIHYIPYCPNLPSVQIPYFIPVNQIAGKGQKLFCTGNLIRVFISAATLRDRSILRIYPNSFPFTYIGQITAPVRNPQISLAVHIPIFDALFQFLSNRNIRKRIHIPPVDVIHKRFPCSSRSIPSFISLLGE